MLLSYRDFTCSGSSIRSNYTSLARETTLNVLTYCQLGPLIELPRLVREVQNSYRDSPLLKVHQSESLPN